LPTWNNSNNATQVLAFEAACGSNYFIHKPGGTWTTYINYTQPVVGSAGRDGQFGVDWGDMGNQTAASWDNIYSYRLRFGGRGD
jgi:hypothetical protein